MLSTQSDEALMEKYRQDEYPAFEALYHRHSGRVLAYFRKRLPNAGDAEDLLQQTFLHLHKARHRYDPQYPFLPWLFSICRNLWIDHLRRRKTIPVDPAVLDTQGSSEGESSGGSEPEDLNAILALLPDGQREILKLRFEQGLSFEVLAQQLSISEVSVRKRVSRAVGRLRELAGSRYRVKEHKR